MHCKCGHSLRTDMEIDDGVCIRCSSKPEAIEVKANWIAVGGTAYNDGAPRIPLMGPDVTDALNAGGDVLSICTAWLKGWDTANLAADW